MLFEYVLHDDFLFLGNRLCIPKCSLRHFIHNLQQVHQQTYDHLIASTTKYKVAVSYHRRQVEFNVGDLVWVVMTKDRMPPHEYNNLKPRKIGALEIVEKINQSAYSLRLPFDLRTSYVFNVKHLMPYMGESDYLDSRTNLFGSMGVDAAHNDNLSFNQI